MNWLCYDAVEVARAMPVMRVMARVLATPTPPPKTATWPCLGSLKALLKIKQSNIFIMLASKVDFECILKASLFYLVFLTNVISCL